MTHALHLAPWNAAQVRLLLRWSRRTGVALTPEVVARLAARYAVKHGAARMAA